MKKIFTLCMFLIMATKLYPSHLAGAFIRYKVLNDTTRTYKIFLEITRECGTNNSNAGLTATAAIDVYCGINCANNILSLTLNRDSFLVKSQICPGLPSNCNGGTLAGLETHYYSITVQLPVCATKYYTFAWSSGNRNGSVLNLNNPSNLFFSVYSSHKFSYVNTPPFKIYPKNTSPILLAPSAPFFYAGSKVCYSLAAIDTVDNDSIAYELVPCAGTNAAGACADILAYAGSPPQYSFTQPFGIGIPHTFDPRTGTLTFTPPPSAIGLYNFAIKIKEYRNGNLIGEYIRDLQCSIIGGGNNISCDPSPLPVPPVIADSANKTITVCCGAPFSADLIFPSSAAGAFSIDSLASSFPPWVNLTLVPSASGLILRFSGTPPCPGGYSENLISKIQQLCLPGVTIPAVSIVTYKLIVRRDFAGFPRDLINPIEDSIICAGGSVKLRSFGNVKPRYWWRVLKGDSTSLNGGFVYNTDSINNYTIQAFPKKTTRYLLTDSSTFASTNFCRKFDTVNIFVIDSFKVAAASVPEDCRNNRYLQSAAIIAPKSFDFNNNKIPLTFEWYAANDAILTNKINTEFNNSLIRSPNFSPFTAGQRCVEVITIPKATAACKQRDTLCYWVRFNEFPKTYNGIKNNLQYCKGDTVQLNAVPLKANTVKTCANIKPLVLPTSAAVANSSNEPVNPFKFANPAASNRFKKIQFILTKQELVASGLPENAKIDRVAFKLSSVGGLSNQNVKFINLKMGITQRNDFNANNNYINGGRTLVNVTGKLITPSNASDLVVLLDNAFLYDGSGNIVVEIFVQMPIVATNFNSAIQIAAIAKSDIACTNSGNDSANTVNAATGTSINERPAMKLGYCNAYGQLTYVWNPATNLGANNPNTFIPNNTGNNITMVLNRFRNDPARKDTQFVTLMMSDDSSSCKDTTVIPFPKIQNTLSLVDPNDPLRKFKTDSICTNTLVKMKVDSIYSLTDNKYLADWYYQDLNNPSNTIRPTNVLANNTTSFTPVYAANQPKVLAVNGKVYPRDRTKVKSNINLCEADSVLITVFPDAKLNFTTSDFSKCINKSYTLVANATNFWQVDKSVANFDSVKYVWDTLPGPVTINSATGIKNQNLVVSNKTTKVFNLSARGACVDSTIKKQITVTVPFIDSLNLDISKSEFDRCAEKPIPLTGLITGKTGSVKPEDYAFTWFAQQVSSSGAPIGTPQLITNTKDASYIFPVSGNYKITYIAKDSCVYLPDTLSEIVLIDKCNIPNVFTPNGDPDNQYFAINFAIGQSAKLKIFDRWGKEVYANENYTCSYGETAIDPANTCFTGSNLSDGTYFYTLDIPNDKKYQGYVQIVNNK